MHFPKLYHFTLFAFNDRKRSRRERFGTRYRDTGNPRNSTSKKLVYFAFKINST